ncbi:uncharacterized protein BDW47DRAFT_99107 [Aspergillus candidus]|uniref:Uncharacterized protein n=1 Tax=Aspergillus candidus TaxID=41067 RepID=A0A2I2FLH0_ASPCN|nr:hypothetical protein BDW47DRAFT_99107 [Aspergillus candidus]PLB41460.1 hypothetical protein BDW47DRAFT_99107 [Aspergillus candidus]
MEIHASNSTHPPAGNGEVPSKHESLSDPGNRGVRRSIRGWRTWLRKRNVDPQQSDRSESG